MSSRRAITILELDRDFLSAVGVSRSGDRVVVHGSLMARRPSEIDPADAPAMGRWVGQRLSEAGLPRGQAIVAVPRRDVVLKRLDVPEGVEDHELGALVRLQMSRQAAVGDGAVIDHGLAVAGVGGRFVLAGALPGQRMAWLGEVAQHAGLKIRHINLLSRGVEPIGRLSSSDELLLAIAPGVGSAEIVVLEAGRPVFARSVELSRADAGEALDAYAERLAVEVKRTWMSYRVSPGASEIDSVVVLGDDDLGRRVAERCGEALEISSRAMGCPGWIESRDEIPSEFLALIGVASASEDDALDFANPRRPADRHAGRRQLVLVGIFALIVVCGGGWYLSSQSLGKLRSELRVARERQKEMASETGELYRDMARRAHLEAWLEADIDWVGHLGWLSARLPNPEDGLVNSIGAMLEGGDVVFTKTGDGLTGDWAVPMLATFSFGGSAEREGLLTELRQRLLEGGKYRVKTVGADVGDRYAFLLTTGERSPAGEDSP